MRARPGRHALLIGLTISLLAHLLIALLNPVLRLANDPGRAETPSTAGYPRRLVPLLIVPSDDESAGFLSASPSRSVRAASPDAVAADTPGGVGDEPGRAEPGAAERLRYRPGAIWAPLDSVTESVEECRQRELAERIRLGIADETYGVPPPPASATPNRNPGIGLRIPFGRKPPPPAQTVPAPLPDSLRLRRPGVRRDTVQTRHRPYRLLPPGCVDTVPLLAPRLRADTTPG